MTKSAQTSVYEYYSVVETFLYSYRLDLIMGLAFCRNRCQSFYFVFLAGYFQKQKNLGIDLQLLETQDDDFAGGFPDKAVNVILVHSIPPAGRGRTHLNQSHDSDPQYCWFA